jgi:hypothetical protein
VYNNTSAGAPAANTRPGDGGSTTFRFASSTNADCDRTAAAWHVRAAATKKRINVLLGTDVRADDSSFLP